jgi:hypothetical protein
MLDFNSLFPMLLVAIFLVAVLILYLQRKKQQELLEYQAEKRNGYVESSNFLTPVRLVLPFGEQSLYIYSVPGGKNRPSKTIADLVGSTALFPQIKIGRNTLFQKALETFGKERFLTGDEELDKMFVVNTEDEATARQMLTYDIQKNMMELASKSPSIEAGPQRFRMMVLRILKDSEEYDLFIDTALAILNKLK